MDEEFEILRAPRPQTNDEEFQIVRPQAEQSQGEQTIDRLRPFTPKRMGQFLEERTLPSFEEAQRRAEAERQTKIEAAESNLANLSSAQRKALAATGKAAESATAGVFPWLAGAAAKGLGKVGVSGYEKYADMPFSEAKKKAEGTIESAATLEPGLGTAGTVAGVVAGAKALPTIAPSAGPAVSGGLTGATYGAVSGLAQEGDLMDALKGAIIGGAGGAIAAPLIERTASGLIRLVAGGRPVVDRSGNLTEEALDVARKAGLDDETIRAISPQLRTTFEARGLTPAAAREAQFNEFGITPKQGMVTGEAKDLVRERNYGNYGSVAEDATAAAERATRGAAPLRDAIGDAINAGTVKASQLKKSYDDAYKFAENVPGKFDRDSITNIGDDLIKQFASDPKTLSFYTSDVARNAAKNLDSVLGKPIQVAPNVSVVHQTFRAVEEGRKILTSELGNAKTNVDRAAIRALIDKFDDRIEQNINNGAFSGDKRVIEDWRRARKLFSEYQNKFGVRRSGEASGSLMKSVLDGTKTSDDVGNMMFNFASTGDATMKREAIKTFLQLRRALGPNSPELDNIKSSYIRQLMTPSTKGAEFKPQDFQRVATQIDDMLRGRGAEFTRRVLSTDEQKMLARYSDVMKMAGKVPHHELEKRLGLWGSAAATAAPLVIGGATTALSFMHPVLGAALSVAAATPGAVSTFKNLPARQKVLANRSPSSEARPYRFPSVRTAVPLAASEAPSLVENAPAAIDELSRAQSLAPEERVGRKSGGRVVDHETEAERLIEMAEKAKKSHSKKTEQFLSHDDTSIAKALEIANKDI